MGPSSRPLLRGRSCFHVPALVRRPVWPGLQGSLQVISATAHVVVLPVTWLDVARSSSWVCWRSVCTTMVGPCRAGASLSPPGSLLGDHVSDQYLHFAAWCFRSTWSTSTGPHTTQHWPRRVKEGRGEPLGVRCEFQITAPGDRHLAMCSGLPGDAPRMGALLQGAVGALADTVPQGEAGVASMSPTRGLG